MEYFQQLQTYFRGLGYPVEAAEYYSRATYMQLMQQQQLAKTSNQQQLISQFMSLTDGQKMTFAQNWLLKNPQYFKKETPPLPTPPVVPPAPTPDKAALDTKKEEKSEETEDTKKKKEEEEEEEKKYPVISGTGTIQGNKFKSGDGESYELKVAGGSVYNLLSDKGLGINGKYKSGSSEDNVDLEEVAISFGGEIITFDSEGELKIGSKEFKKEKNDLDGKIVKSGSKYILSAGDYEITLSGSESAGVRLSITGTDVKKDGVAPEGLWGVTFDGEEQKRRDILDAIKVKEYKVSSLKNFSFDDHNNIGGGETEETKKTTKKTKSEEEENLSLWQESNPKLETALGKIGGGTFQYFGLNMTDTSDDASWNMTKLSSSAIYNLFSENELQVGGKFNSTTAGLNYPREFGFLADGKVIKVNRSSSADNKLSVTVDGTTLTAGGSNGKASLNADQTQLTVSATVDGESWTFTVNADMANAEGLEMNISGSGIGKNDTRTSGLWGAFIGSSFVGDAGTNDTNGAGYIRNSEGARTWFNYDDIGDALESYQLSDYDTEDEGYSVYAGY